MIWFSNENIDIEMIIYNRSILGDINESISSSDQENESMKNQLASEETIQKENVAINKNNFKFSKCRKIFRRDNNP